MEPKSWMELGAFILMVFAVFALIEKRADKRRKEDQDTHKLIHDAVNKDISDIKHDVKHNEAAIIAVAANRTSDVERIVKLEIGQQNIKEALGRVETNIEKNHKETLDTMKGWIEQVTDSIREIRNVAPKT
jgi:ABC-type nickel/cobalt efflux system permease component RcnA